MYARICIYQPIYLSIHPFIHTGTHIRLKPTIKASGVTFKIFVKEGLKNSDLVANGVRDCAQSPLHILNSVFILFKVYVYMDDLED